MASLDMTPSLVKIIVNWCAPVPLLVRQVYLSSLQTALDAGCSSIEVTGQSSIFCTHAGLPLEETLVVHGVNPDGHSNLSPTTVAFVA